MSGSVCWVISNYLLERKYLERINEIEMTWNKLESKWPLPMALDTVQVAANKRKENHF